MLPFSFPRILIAVTLIPTFLGCASNLHDQNTDSPNEDNPVAAREAGLACLDAQDFDCAIENLKRADAAGVAGGAGLVALGTAYEAKGLREKALETYSRYPELGFLSRHRRKMARRVRSIVREDILSQVDSLGGRSARPGAIAVLPLQMNTNDDRLRPLAAGLSEWLVTDLYHVRDLDILERIRAEAVLKELEYGDLSLVDATSAPRVGHMLGASRIVSGSVIDLGSERLRIDLFSWDVEVGRQEVAVSAEGKSAAFFELEKNLVFGLIDGLGIELTDRERAEIERVPTRSLAAFLAHAAGLEADRREEYELADQLYEEAAELDPVAAENSEVPLAKQPEAESDGQDDGQEDLAEESTADPESEVADIGLDDGFGAILDETMNALSGESWGENIIDSRPDRPEEIELVPDPPPPPPPPKSGGR